MAGRFTSFADRSVRVSKAILNENSRYGHMLDNWPTMLSDELGNVVKSLEQRSVSEASGACITVKDLQKGFGDHIEVPVVHELGELPVMGNRVAEGKGESWSESEFKAKIDVTRKPIDLQTLLDQQRRGYSLTKAGIMLGKTYYSKLNTERMVYQCVGRRGTIRKSDQIIPLHIDGPINSDGLTFDELLINPLKPPTNDRTFFASAGANNVTSIDGTPYFSTKDSNQMSVNDVIDPISIRRWKQHLEETEHPLKKASYTLKHNMPKTTPMYYGFLTPAQWTTLERSMSVSDFKQCVANALKRTSGWDHPLFKNDGVMIDDIYFQKYFLPVAYAPGDEIPMCDDDPLGTTRMETVPPGFNVDFGFIMGAGALCHVLGATMPGGGSYDIDTRKWDGKFRSELILSSMDGIAQIDLKDKTGRRYTNGICSIASATPLRDNQ